MYKLVIDLGINKFECTEIFNEVRKVPMITVKEYSTGNFIGTMKNTSLPIGTKENDDYWYDDLEKFKSKLVKFLLRTDLKSKKR